MKNVALYNVILLGILFHFSSIAYVTLYNCQKYVIDALRSEDSSYKADASYGFFVTYLAFAFTTIWASMVINCIGPRSAIIVSSIFNIIHIAQFLFPVVSMFYVGSFLSGVTGAILWTAQGNFLTRNSTRETIGRNTGILWALIQSGSISGNLYMVLVIKDNDFDAKDRKWFFGFLTTSIIIPGLTALLLRKAAYNLETPLSIGQKFIKSLKLFYKRDMLLLCVPFFYNGLELSFYSGVYSSAVGHNLNFKELNETTRVSLSGILIGCGEVVGGTIFGLYGKRTIVWGRYPIVLTGCFIHTVTYLLISINLPNSITLGKRTNVSAIIQSNLPLAFICSFALGFADACYVTQIYDILGSIFASEGPSTFAIFRFIQSLGSMIAHISTPIGLYGFLGSLLTVNIASAICFCIVELLPTYKPLIIEENIDNT